MKKTTEPDASGIDKAIKKAGSQVKLASLIGAKQQMVAYWKKAGLVSDASMCAAIEQATGVPCEELNPNEDWITLRVVLCAPDRQSVDSIDDTQHNAGGSIDKKVEMRRHVQV
jgi:DNA-binding transcriptional regulator YdaS (Cro superfamily)